VPPEGNDHHIYVVRISNFISIGAAISRALAKFPIRALALHYVRAADAAEKLCNELTHCYPSLKVTVHQADLSVVHDCERLVKEVLDAHGKIDIFISNAGGAKRIVDILYHLKVELSH
jgi:NAD(P)-dependent dehydrogenase (short-subunit alcohol dehydrogenase family)